jgi:hypothetical protein
MISRLDINQFGIISSALIIYNIVFIIIEWGFTIYSINSLKFLSHLEQEKKISAILWAKIIFFCFSILIIIYFFKKNIILYEDYYLLISLIFLILVSVFNPLWLLQFLNKTELSKTYEPFNPEQNTELGVSYLRYLHDLFNKEVELTNTRSTLPAGDSHSLEKLAVAAFNAGEGRVAQAQRKAQNAGMDPGNYYHVEQYLPESTQDYVLKVDSARARYAGEDTLLEGS